MTKIIAHTACAVLFSLLAIRSMGFQPAPLPDSVIVIFSDAQVVRDPTSVASRMRHSGKEIHIHNLDDVARLEKHWSKNLPANEKESKAIFETRLRSVGRENFQNDLVSAYAGVIASRRYQIKKHPAIIFDKKWVVYGVTDLGKALDIYQQHKQREVKAND